MASCAHREARTLNISVVIPAFNVAEWIGDCVRSVLEQSIAPQEIIVVDDGSTDQTASIAASVGDVVRVVTQTNRGLAAARNAGAEAATCDGIVFLDADDELLPEAIAALTGAAESFPHAGAVSPNYIRESTAGMQTPAWPAHPQPYVLDRRDVPTIIRHNHLVANSLVKREVWLGHRFREDLVAGEDQAFWLSLLFARIPVVVVGQPLVRVRVKRPGSLTSQTIVMRRSRRLLFEDLWERDDLSLAERSVVAYQLVRSSAGELVAEAAAGARSKPLDRSPNRLVRMVRRVLPRMPGIVRWLTRREMKG